MSEIAQAFNWCVAIMQADSALMAAAVGGVWQGSADIGTQAPYALISAQTPGQDALTMNAVRLYTDIVLQLKAVGPTSNYAALVTIADRIDTLFGSISFVPLSSGGILECYREQALSYEELVNGQLWSHLGGLYHIKLQGS